MSTRRWPPRSRSSPRPPSRSRPSSSCPDRWRMKTATMSASRRPSPSSASEMAWLVADELVQVQGEQLRDRSVAGARRAVCQRSRSCATCGSAGSSRALPRSCACSSPDAVDTHLSVAGGLIDPNADLSAKAKAARRAAAFYARWLPPAGCRQGTGPTACSSDLAPRACASSSAAAAGLPARCSTGCPRWRGSWSASRGFPRRIVDIGAELFAMTAACVPPRCCGPTTRRQGRRQSSPARFCRQAGCGWTRTVRSPVAQHRPARPPERWACHAGPIRLVGGGRHRRLAQGPWIADTTPARQP